MTIKLISMINNNPFETIDGMTVKELEEVIEYSSNKYYNSEKPVVSDAVYDIMIEFLQKKAPKSKVLKNIGSSVINKKLRVPLDYHLGSMDKIKPGNKNLTSWINKYKGPYYLSDKLDGISALLTINKDFNMKLNTRGTSTEGLDISGLIKYMDIPSENKIKKIVSKIGNGSKNIIALRGELIMKQKTFKKNWSDKKKNVRNTIAGLVNSKVFDPNLAKDTDLVIYEIVDPFIDFPSGMEAIKKSFNVVNYKKFDSIDDNSLSKYLKERKEKGEYDIDGIIVTNGSKHKRNTSGNPKYAFAFKDLMENMIKEAIVKKVEWKISKDGKIVPTLIIKPIDFDGVTVSRVTAHNASYVYKNKIGKNTIIKITRSGEVIPYIFDVVKPSKQPDMPDIEYKWNKTKVDILVIGDNDMVKLRNLQYFFSTIDAKGFGPANVEKLYENNFDTVKKVLEMSVDDFMTLDGIKEKSATKLVNSLKKTLSDIKLETLMSASNIFGSGFGERRIEAILMIYPNILSEGKKWTKQEFINKLMDIDGFSSITVNQFVDNFKEYNKFHKSISKFIKLKNVKKPNKKLDMTIVMSGFRDKDIQSKLEEMGGKVSNSISKNTTYLVVIDPKSTSSKITKAKKLGVEIISKEDLIKKIN